MAKNRKKPRPLLGPAVRALIRDAAKRLPELAHVKAARVLVVAGEARRASRATVKPLSFADSRERISKDGKRAKPIVRIRGKRMLYVITLRPRFFLRSTPEQRVETILHELWHCSPRFDGTLDPSRRHSKLPGRAFRERFFPLVRRYLAVIPPELLAPFAFHGEVRVRQWLERPGPWFPVRRTTGAARDRSRRVFFTEQQLFTGPLPMSTPERPSPRAAPRRRTRPR